MKTQKLDYSFIPFIIVTLAILSAIVVFWINFNADAFNWCGVF